MNYLEHTKALIALANTVADTDLACYTQDIHENFRQCREDAANPDVDEAQVAVVNLCPSNPEVTAQIRTDPTDGSIAVEIKDDYSSGPELAALGCKLIFYAMAIGGLIGSDGKVTKEAEEELLGEARSLFH